MTDRQAKEIALASVRPKYVLHRYIGLPPESLAFRIGFALFVMFFVVPLGLLLFPVAFVRQLVQLKHQPKEAWIIS
jgi:hypothetical protein